MRTCIPYLTRSLALLIIVGFAHAQVANNTALVGTVFDPEGHTVVAPK